MKNKGAWVIVVLMLAGWLVALAALQMSGSLWAPGKWEDVPDKPGYTRHVGYAIGPWILWIPSAAAFALALGFLVESDTNQGAR